MVAPILFVELQTLGFYIVHVTLQFPLHVEEVFSLIEKFGLESLAKLNIQALCRLINHGQGLQRCLKFKIMRNLTALQAVEV